MEAAQLNGLGVAVVTPFKEDHSIDFKSLEKLINHLIKGGVDYLVIQGTTGEAATLTIEEKNAVLDFALEANGGRVPLVFGHGGNNTRALIAGMNNIKSLDKVDAVLSASPYYSKPNQNGIYEHYSALAQACPKPIILYNVPGRTGSNMLAHTTISLARAHKNIIAVKEASGDLGQMTQLLKNKPNGFQVISGDDDLVLHQCAMGAAGVISVVANAFPTRFKKLITAASSGDMATAQQYHFQLCDIIPQLFKEGNPAGIKALLAMLGICGTAVRLPLTEASDELKDELYREVSNAGISLD